MLCIFNYNLKKFNGHVIIMHNSSVVENMYIHIHNNVALIYLDKSCDTRQRKVSMGRMKIVQENQIFNDRTSIDKSLKIEKSVE